MAMIKSISGIRGEIGGISGNGLTPLDAEDIADALEFILTRPEHVSINDIQINPKQQASATVAYRKMNNTPR